MSTPPGKNVTHHDRDPALVATEQDLLYIVHDEAWSMFWALDATYGEALKMKERIAGSRECRTVAMTAYARTADVTPVLQRVAVGTPGPSANPSVRAAMQRIKQQMSSPPPQPQVPPARAPQPRPPQLVSVPPPAAAPVVTIPPLPALPPLEVDPNSDFAKAARQPLPRDPAMPPALVMAPPAPQPMPPPPIATGPTCDACGVAVPENLPLTNEMRICESCKVQGEYDDKPLDEIV